VLIVFNQKHFPFNFRPTIVTAFKDNHGIKLSISNHEIGGVYYLYLISSMHLLFFFFFFRACLLGSDYNFILLVFLFRIFFQNTFYLKKIFFNNFNMLI
jgi:hypothetical protein